MPLAHVCTDCGADLALAVPQADPYYDLPIVWCDRCGRGSVRLVHPMLRAWRDAQRAACALAWLALKVGLALGICMLSLYASRLVLDQLPIELMRPSEWPWPYAMAAFGLAAFNTGIWVTAGLGHLSRRAAWLGWAAFLYGTIAFAALMGLLLTEVGSDRLEILWDLSWFALAFTVLLAVAPSGIPFGRAILASQRARAARRARGHRGSRE